MKVLRHRLQTDDGEAVPFRRSPNVGGALDPKYLVMHYTAGRSAADSAASIPSGPLHLDQLGGEFYCQKDSFLCAASGIEIEIAFTKKLSAGFFGGEGFILQRLVGDAEPLQTAQIDVRGAGASRRPRRRPGAGPALGADPRRRRGSFRISTRTRQRQRSWRTQGHDHHQGRRVQARGRGCRRRNPSPKCTRCLRGGSPRCRIPRGTAPACSGRASPCSPGSSRRRTRARGTPSPRAPGRPSSAPSR